jgi:ketosteroid isomerase-like protein
MGLAMTRNSLCAPRAVLAASLAMTMFAQPARAQSGADNKAIVQAAFEDWATGTGSPYDLLADDLVWTITGNSLASKTYRSREAFMGEVIQPFVARMRVGLKPTSREIHADRDTVIVLFDAVGMARDGQPYENTYAWFLRFGDGRITEATAFFDSIAFDELWTRVNPDQ